MIVKPLRESIKRATEQTTEQQYCQSLTAPNHRMTDIEIKTLDKEDKGSCQKAKKIVEKLKIQFQEETRLKKRNLSETKADIHVVSMKTENKKTLTYSIYQVVCRMRYK